MNVEDVAAFGRSFIEAAMSSACVIRRPGELVTDPDTGEVAHDSTTVYTGKCRYRPTGTQAREVETTGGEAVQIDGVLSVPFAVTDVAKGDRATITASPDASLVGVEVEVISAARGESISARRLSCREVT